MALYVSPRTSEVIDTFINKGIVGLDFETGGDDLRNAYADSWRVINYEITEAGRTELLTPRTIIRKMLSMAASPDQGRFMNVAMLGHWSRGVEKMTSAILFSNTEDVYSDQAVHGLLAAACREVETVDDPYTTASILLNYAASITLTNMLEAIPDRIDVEQALVGVDILLQARPD